MDTHPRTTTIADIASMLEAWAPPGAAQSYDNVGLQVGRADRSVERVLIALDLTPAVIEEARREHVELVITHHPLIFRPLRNLTTSSFVGGLALALAEDGIALYAAHTNLDAARDGVSFALARTLGLQNVHFLQSLPDTLYKLTTFVPVDHADAVRKALADAGAGRIGAYDSCAFESEGSGYFRAGQEANPYIGEAGGGVERANEKRIEVEVSRWDLPGVVRAMKAAHPYEEVAYDVYPIVQETTRYGMGAVGDLPTPLPLRDFLESVATCLQADALRFAGETDATVRRVAVCGGSGSDLIATAQRAGADAFVTGDVTYHRFFEAMDLTGRCGMAIIDAGHYETEWVTESLLVERLGAQFPDVSFRRTSARTSPAQWHVRDTTK